MRKGAFFLILSFSLALAGGFLYAATPEPAPASLLSLQLNPVVNIPVGDSARVFTVGGAGALSVEYRLPPIPAVYLRGGLVYDYDPIAFVTQSLSVLSGTAGAGYRLGIAPWLALKAFLSGGAFYCFINGADAVPGSWNPCLEAGAGASFLFGPIGVEVGASYRHFFGLYGGVGVFLGASYQLPAAQAGGAAIQKPATVKPAPLQAQPAAGAQNGVQLGGVTVDALFPVFHKYYDDHSLGKATVKNGSSDTVSGVKVSFQIKQYMDGPKEGKGPAELKPGESAEYELNGIFKENILDVTEDTKVQAEIVLEYTQAQQAQKQTSMQTVRVYKRNAMNWDDDRKAAAFITATDPSVLGFSKNVAGLVSSKGNKAVNSNLLAGIGFHEALVLYGVNYVTDPTSPYVERSQQKQAVDFLQFPRQTLEYKAGDCDDLSILYCAFFESVGIETAFITVPGHIYMAFSLGVNPEEARKSFTQADDIIFREGKSWIPVEVTERTGGFLVAWQTGAKEWREGLSHGQAGFFPVHDAWTVFEPVQLPGAVSGISLPPMEKIASRLQEESVKFVDKEIFSKVLTLQAKIQQTQNSPKSYNDLGALYARYGLLDKAQKEFEKAAARDEYVPALVNLGNIFYLTNEKEKSLAFYERAYKKAPKDAKVLLGAARANHELENYGVVKKLYTELKSVSPDLADQFSYLDLKGEEATRAADIMKVKDVVIWDED